VFLTWTYLTLYRDFKKALLGLRSTNLVHNRIATQPWIWFHLGTKARPNLRSHLITFSSAAQDRIFEQPLIMYNPRPLDSKLAVITSSSRGRLTTPLWNNLLTLRSNWRYRRAFSLQRLMTWFFSSRGVSIIYIHPVYKLPCTSVHLVPTEYLKFISWIFNTRKISLYLIKDLVVDSLDPRVLLWPRKPKDRLNYSSFSKQTLPLSWLSF
jgi:hypothetical protein